MYVRAGEAPTLTTYDCRPYKLGSEESCSFPTPDATTYHVMLRGFSAFSNISLTGTYNDVPIPNEPPVASFTYDCNGLRCDFDGSGSTDDGEIVKYGWNTRDNKILYGPFVSHEYSTAGTYRVLLVLTDDEGLRTIHREFVAVSVGKTPIDIWMKKRQFDTNNVAHPRWSGANGANVDVYFNGSYHTTTPNDGVWWHIHAPVPATYTYKICEEGSTTVCSADIDVVFE